MLETEESSTLRQMGIETEDNGIGPSKQTMDRSLAAKMYIEQYYTTLLQNARERGDRYDSFNVHTHQYQHLITYILNNKAHHSIARTSIITLVIYSLLHIHLYLYTYCDIQSLLSQLYYVYIL